MGGKGSAADVVFANGAVYTVDAARRWAQAVAVKDGSIVAVGTDADVRRSIGAGTEVHDLKGRMLLPGFQDAHIHAVAGGHDRLRCEMHDAYSLDEYKRIIREYAEANPDKDWILGGGWSMGIFPGGTPGKEILDEIVPDRAVYLPNRDGHGAWVNSRALKLSGVTRDTPDPADGRIQRDELGEPSGTLHEGAMDLVGDRAPEPSPEELAQGLREAQRYLHSLGITGWQDAIVGPMIWSNNLDTYIEAAERGELTARVVGALWWDRHRDEEQIEELVENRSRGDVGRFRATSVKIMQDGVIENYTAGVLDPYLDREGHVTDNRGLSFVDPERLKSHVTRLDAEGFQVHFHALGDRAVREALDAIEAARRANGPNDLRHHLAHIQVVHPDDVPRFRALGVVANGQPLWAMNEGQMVDLTLPFLGPERSRRQYLFATLGASGAVLAFGSDWPVSSPNPLWEIHVAVNRAAPRDYPYASEDEVTREPFLPEESIDLPTAIAAFTIGSAYVNHLDGVTGSIEVGKRADLAVLDRNLFEHPSSEIADAEVLLTLVEGEIVHADPSLS